ncbi:capsid protein [Peromfec virus RodF5_43]|uniref:Capsid protein n=1 Tax=Peromfec virus RodF5_43 TaxID=2929286 RepID=A0A976N2H5_9CIRC|nr:capsid protein [Peromfec virus RodF5_43]
MVYYRRKKTYRKPFKGRSKTAGYKVRSYRTRMYRSRYVRRKKKSGNFTLEVRQTTLLQQATPAIVIAPTFNEFQELKDLAPNFEAYRIWSVKVKITPNMNVAMIGDTVTTSTPSALFDAKQFHYISAPWHRPVDKTTIDANSLLSIDRSREYMGCAQSNRTFVPAVLTSALVNEVVTVSKLNWRPRIEISDSDSINIAHYCGLYWFQALDRANDNEVRASYNLVLTMKVTLYNQKSKLN